MLCKVYFFASKLFFVKRLIGLLRESVFLHVVSVLFMQTPTLPYFLCFFSLPFSFLLSSSSSSYGTSSSCVLQDIVKVASYRCEILALTKLDLSNNFLQFLVFS